MAMHRNLKEPEMIHHERTLDVDATPEAVWAVLGRFMHMHEWSERVDSIDALTDDNGGLGSMRRCHFDDGTSVVEEVTEWVENRKYRVRMSELSAMPLNEAHAELSVEPLGEGRSRLKMAMDYRVKYGPLGWVLGQTMMKMMMGKIFNSVLKALADKVQSGATAPSMGAPQTA